MSTLPHLDNSWMFDLVSDDPRLRGAALARHEVASDEYSEQWQRAHELDALIWTLRDDDRDVPPGLLAESDQVGRALREAGDGTLCGLVDRFVYGDADESAALAPYAVLFLTLENRYPETWDTELAAGSPWHLKKRVLHRFVRDGVPVGCRDMATEAVIDAAYRLHRCEDRRYPLLARHLDSVALREELAEAYDNEDVIVAARAGYLLWALENPDSPVSLRSWRDWIVEDLIESPV